jgi:hypothetical protein
VGTLIASWIMQDLQRLRTSIIAAGTVTPQES